MRLFAFRQHLSPSKMGILKKKFLHAGDLLVRQNASKKNYGEVRQKKGAQKLL